MEDDREEGRGTRKKHDKAGWCQSLFSLLQVGVGVFMLVVAVKYEGRESCTNGAVTFLFWGGLATTIVNSFSFIAFVARQLMRRDGEVTCWESLCLCAMGLITAGAAIMDITTLIWGSVVVFGSWPQWTEEDPESIYYCLELPMMVAFVLMIVRWCFLGLFVLTIVSKYCKDTIGKSGGN